MATSNERIRDELIRRQMDFSGFSAGLGARMRKLLASADVALQNELRPRLDRLADPRARVTFGKLTVKRLQSMDRAIRELLRPVHTDLRELTRSELLELAATEASFVQGVIQASLPVIVNLNLPDSNLLRHAVVGRPFQGKILRRWMQELETGDRRRISDAVRIGLVLGESSAEIGRRIFGTARQQGEDGVRGVTRRAAQGIAQTAITHVTNQAKQLLYLANVELIPIEIFIATLDAKTTPICSSLDGQRFPTGTGPIPPIHFNCRSTRIPGVKGALAGDRPANSVTTRQMKGLNPTERQALVKRLVGPVPATVTYPEFLRKQSVAFQNEKLGPTRAKLFRDGGMTLDRFVNPQGLQFTLKQLRQREPGAFQRAGLQTE